MKETVQKVKKKSSKKDAMFDLVYKMHLEGYSGNKIAETLHIHRNTVSTWKKEHTTVSMEEVAKRDEVFANLWKEIKVINTNNWKQYNKAAKEENEERMTYWQRRIGEQHDRIIKAMGFGRASTEVNINQNTINQDWKQMNQILMKEVQEMEEDEARAEPRIELVSSRETTKKKKTRVSN